MTIERAYVEDESLAGPRINSSVALAYQNKCHRLDEIMLLTTLDVTMDQTRLQDPSLCLQS